MDAADDPVFLGNFNRVLSAYDTYHNEPLRRNGSEWLRATDLVAYFCAEFGFHESLPIYSGGLGILAGDHCKAASDMRLPFVGVGLLYRQGYFSQTIDIEGNQHAVYTDSDFESLPVTPVPRADGSEVKVYVDAARPARGVQGVAGALRPRRRCTCSTPIWRRTTSTHRNITHQLYGGDRTTRIEQEIVLGVGGVRALAELRLKPTVWHINEGHAAFLVLERVRALVSAGPGFRRRARGGRREHRVHHAHAGAGRPRPFRRRHDLELLPGLLQRAEARAEEQFLALGRVDDEPRFQHDRAGDPRLALPERRQPHPRRRVLAHLRAAVAADRSATRTRCRYVTNGVHVPTFLAQEWADVFEKYLGFDWSQRITDQGFWQRVDEIPDHLFWSVRQSLKAQMLHLVRHRVARQHFRNRGSRGAPRPAAASYADPVNPNVLTIGFARRFATYKRATLLFEDLDWLRADSRATTQRPVLFIFAGKAHPADQPGQDLIRRIDADRAHAGVRGPHPAGRGLRPASRAPAGVGRRRVAQQPDLSAGGERHLRHEGRHQRRDQPVGARRLVGRGLRRQERLGDQAGGGEPRRCAPQPRGSQARSTSCCRTT